MGASMEQFVTLAALFDELHERLLADPEALYADYQVSESDNLAEPIDYLKYAFWDKGSGERASYLTRRQYAQLCHDMAGGVQRGRLRDKVIFSRVYHDFLGRKVWSMGLGSDDDLVDLCSRPGGVVVKPRIDGYGRGVGVIERPDAHELRDRSARDGCLVEERIVQHEALAELHSSSVNTVRTVMAVGRSGEAHLVAAAVRCGRGGAVVDSGSGLFAALDVSSGRVTSDAYDHFRHRFETHPDSGVRFRARVMPGWDDLVTRSCEAALVPRSGRLIAFDWACLPNATWALVEANLEGGLGPCQEAGGRGLARDVFYALGEG